MGYCWVALRCDALHRVIKGLGEGGELRWDEVVEWLVCGIPSTRERIHMYVHLTCYSVLFAVCT